MDAPKKLRAWRGKRTLREAADLVGCDPSYLSLLENRKKKPFDRKLSIQLERIAGIPPEAWDDDDVHPGMLADTLTGVKTGPDESSAPPTSDDEIASENENPSRSAESSADLDADDMTPERRQGAA